MSKCEKADSRKSYVATIGFSVRDVTDGDPSGFLDTGIVYSGVHAEQRQLLENFVGAYGSQIAAALKPFSDILLDFGNAEFAGNEAFQAAKAGLESIIAANPPEMVATKS